jgi:hypothetical protein
MGNWDGRNIVHAQGTVCTQPFHAGSHEDCFPAKNMKPEAVGDRASWRSCLRWLGASRARLLARLLLWYDKGNHKSTDLAIMKFIETTGKTLARIVNDGVNPPLDLHAAGVGDDTIVRINRHGDIEVRRRDRWDVIGGLLGNFEIRTRGETGLDWV